MSFFILFSFIFLCPAARASEPRTGFQTSRAWQAELNLPADVVFVYSTNADTIKSWADQGYETWVMLGASWLSKETDVVVQHPEIKQATRDGTPFEMIPGRAWVVPVQPWIDWFNQRVDEALAAGARGILPEEPEFFASTGYSESFKQAWLEYYGEPWRPPHESVENNWRAGQLKTHLFEEFFRQVCGHVKQKDPTVKCIVPVHSNLNYTDWKILAPHHAFLALKNTDGFIGQVWTGTAKGAHMLGGEPFASVFHYAYLEYNYFAELVRGTEKQMWFLTDPVEDAKGADWSDLRAWYEDTLTAALLNPSVNRFEVTPWPSRVFLTEDLYGSSRIPPEYATELLTIWSAQKSLPLLEKIPELEDGYNTNFGFLTSDTAMWQAGKGMNRFSGHLAPMLELTTIMRPRILHAERFAEPGYPPEDIKIIIASFDAWKPVSRNIVTNMARWIKNGGVLIFLGGADDYNDMPSSWWRELGYEAPSDALLAELGLTVKRRKSWMPNIIEGLDTASQLATQTRTLYAGDSAPEYFTDSIRGAVNGLSGIKTPLPLTAYVVDEMNTLFHSDDKPIIWDAKAGDGMLVYAGIPGECLAVSKDCISLFYGLLYHASTVSNLPEMGGNPVTYAHRPPFHVLRSIILDTPRMEPEKGIDLMRPASTEWNAILHPGEQALYLDIEEAVSTCQKQFACLIFASGDITEKKSIQEDQQWAYHFTLKGPKGINGYAWVHIPEGENPVFNGNYDPVKLKGTSITRLDIPLSPKGTEVIISSK